MMRRPLVFGAALLLAASAASGALGVRTVHAAGAAPAPPGCSVVSDIAAAGWSNEPQGGTHLSCSYTTQGLTRTYWVYAPPGFTGSARWPLIVVLHGCTQQGPDIAYLSHFDLEAQLHHFLVVYPNQASYTMTGPTTFDGNGSDCWNWFLPQGQNRGAGEPALIAGITRTVSAAMNADTNRVYMIGVSAGGATADIMAATYPDIYAAVAVVAGCEYKGLPCLSSASAVPPQVSGQEAYQAATDATGSHARAMPFLVENGDTDTVVPLPNAFEVVQQLQVANDYAEHGGAPVNTVPSSSCADQTVVPNPPVDSSATPPIVYNPYDIFSYTPDGSPCPASGSFDAAMSCAQLYVVHGEFHAWPGGPNLNTTQSSAQIYTNPGGPDLTDIAYRFFIAHPMGSSLRACGAVPAASVPDAGVAAALPASGTAMLGLVTLLWTRRRRRETA